MIPRIHSFAFVPLVFGLVFFRIFAPELHAESIEAQEWHINADKMTKYDNPRSVIAEGNVVLKKIEKHQKVKKATSSKWKDLTGEDSAISGSAAPADEKTVLVEEETITTIKADWLVYDQEFASVKARGNVEIGVGTDLLRADEGTIDLNRETGTFHNASIIRQENALHLEGKVIKKTGAVSYLIDDGWVITCKLKENEIPPWSFGSAETEITDGGYAYLKHATFRIKNVPVLYTPWMMLPAKRERQTGLLLPEVSLSDRDGFGVNMPLFIDLAPNMDMTIYPEYYAKRGFMSGLEYRYIFSEGNKGALIGNYLSDDLSDPSETEYYQDGNYTHTNKDRYWVRGKADYGLGTGWTTRVDVDVVSDRDYLSEFTSGMTGYRDSNNRFLEMFGRGFQEKTTDGRENTLNILKSWSTSSFQARMLAINDVRVDTSGNTPIWQLPALLYTGFTPVVDNMLDFSWDAKYNNFWREEGVGAHRFDIRPEFSMPLPLGRYLEANASLAFQETAYIMQEYGDATWAYSENQNRFLYDFETEIGTTLMRDFAFSMGSASGLSHQFRPYIGYEYISDEDQDELPVFDGIDRIYERNAITYGLDNFFDLLGSSTVVAQDGTTRKNDYERDYAFLKLKHGYDIRSSRSDEPWLPINVELGYYPLSDLTLIYKTNIGVYGEGVTDYGLEAYYKNSRGDFLSTDYRFNRFSDIHSIKTAAYVNLFWSLAAGYSIERSLEDSKTVEERVRLLYQPSCWSVELSSNYTPGEQELMVVFNLANLGNPLRLDL